MLGIETLKLTVFGTSGAIIVVAVANPNNNLFIDFINLDEHRIGILQYI